MIKVSIIIPTHDRPRDVIENVAALLAQVSDYPFEIIVVESASASETSKQLISLADRPGVRVMRVESPGSSLARNVGVRNSVGEWLAFVDDDILVRPRWAENVMNRLRDAPPDLGFIGGRVIGMWPAQGYEIDPDRLGRRARILLSTLDDQSSFECTTQPIGIGANMFVSRRAFDQVGGFQLDRGRFGAGLGSGEETQLIEAVIRAGYRGWYDGSIAVDHKISADRLQSQWLARRARHEGAVSYRRLERPGDRALFAARCLATIPFFAVRSQRYESSSEAIIRYSHNIGVVLTALGARL
jgi:glycosyltransferase involved in cell wall biosynthesis